MIYVGFKSGLVVGLVNIHADTLAHPEWSFQTRNDWKTKEAVDQIAADLSTVTGTKFIGIDGGEGISPRFDIIRCPAVGDDVSMAFNGDYYVCGKIVSVSGTMKVIRTSDGKKFYRKGESGTWKYLRTWTLIQGHYNTRNPHF